MPLTGPTYEARVERVIDASPEAVFDAFTSEAAQAEWFAGPSDTIVTLSLDVRVGGRWECAFDHEGERFSWEGTFVEVDRPKRFTAELTNTWPNGESFPSLFTVTCEPRDGKTFLTVTETHVSEFHRNEAQSGIPGMIDIIQRLVEAETADR